MFIMADFYEMDFMKGIVILVNVDEMYKILESLLANRFWSRDKGAIGWSKFLLSLLLCPYVCYIPALLKNILQKEHFISDAWPAFSHKSFGKCFGKTLSSWAPLCSLSSLYLTRNKEILKCTHTLLAIHWAVLIKTFHISLSWLKSDLLPYRWKPVKFQEVLIS